MQGLHRSLSFDRDDDSYADEELLRELEAEYGIEGDFTVCGAHLKRTASAYS
jgi:hypothetical protein